MKLEHRSRRYAVVTVLGLVAAGLTVTVTAVSQASPRSLAHSDAVPVPATVPAAVYRPAASAATPVKHLVVIFDENESFDHYFGTYPDATNTNGSPFHAKSGTPAATNLLSNNKALLTHNPNEFNPERLSPSESLTCDQDHQYQPEQQAADDLKMDMFVQFTAHDTCTGQPVLFGATGLVMDYFDGNTVTALWNYAQNYAMSDNNFDPQFGPSTIGALNLISGNTGGGYAVSPTTGAKVSDPGSVGSVDGSGVGTIYSDLDPAFDDCSDNSHTSTSPVGVMTGQNVGNLLNTAHVTWGWFQGGFAPTGKNKAGFAVCGSEHENIGKIEVQDYVPHHDPFQFYKSTANPKHLPPSSEAEIGKTDQANHNYDISDFFLTLEHGNLPSVSFLKPPAYENSHAGNSDPIDEQRWLVTTINAIEKSPDWSSTAIVVTYDDSDGWYDQQAPPILNGSDDLSLDTSMCTAVPVTVGTRNDRCGFGPRLPMLVISPWTRQNFISHDRTDTDSVLAFIEDNWLNDKRIPDSYDAISGSLVNGTSGLLDFSAKPHDTPVILDPKTGEVIPAADVTSVKPASGSPKGGTKVTIHGKNFHRHDGRLLRQEEGHQGQGRLLDRDHGHVAVRIRHRPHHGHGDRRNQQFDQRGEQVPLHVTRTGDRLLVRAPFPPAVRGALGPPGRRFLGEPAQDRRLGDLLAVASQPLGYARHRHALYPGRPQHGDGLKPGGLISVR
jgi:phospholipase C